MTAEPSPVMLMVCQSMLYQPQWELGHFCEHETSQGLYGNGDHHRGIKGGYFQKLFTPKCRLFDPGYLAFLSFFFFFVT